MLQGPSGFKKNDPQASGRIKSKRWHGNPPPALFNHQNKTTLTNKTTKTLQNFLKLVLL
jgi:hypothetical protein